VEQELYRIVQEAKRGQTEAFATLVTRFQGSVFRQAYAMLGDSMEAEDVAQEAFLKAYSSLAKLESEFAFASWLSRIVSHLCCDRLQKRKKDFVAGEKMQASLASPDEIPGSTGHKQLQLQIEEAMRKLSPEQREAIILRDIQGFSYIEMADIWQIPIGTVRSRIHAARLALREYLK